MSDLDDRVHVGGLAVDRALFAFVTAEALPGSGVSAEAFWDGLSGLVQSMAARNRELLEVRVALQTAIDEWHRARRGRPHDAPAYRAFLESIGYIVAEGPSFEIDTNGLDPEISTVAGPQLVVPVTNVRYALNAVNARWGSLYDALYGTDALGSPPPEGPFDAARGALVVAWVRQFLDDIFPLEHGSHAGASGYVVDGGRVVVSVSDGSSATLADPSAFFGYRGPASAPTSVVLANHGLRVELVIDPTTQVGAVDGAGVADVVIEAAVTTIVDFEDSVAAVDAVDKVTVYRNWLGLMRGDLSTEVSKAGRTFVRRLNDDRHLRAPDGSELVARGRALMLARNVGHLMTTPAVLDGDGNEVPEGLLDAMLTVLVAKHDLAKAPELRNSPAGSVYVVKPKMHGPAEVAFTNDVFTFVEDILDVAPNTVKIGIMDEERRTTVNLAECIRAARSRLAFINTGFLDRTGDEIHTSMEAGPVVRKADMRSERWISSYEDWNVDVGLACGLRGRAQIGKGMWAAPDRMADMLRDKIGHPLAGASCAWVPSPTAATLHATHYHRVDVAARQAELVGSRRASLDGLLAIPVVGEPAWTETERRSEIDNNLQGILGYVVRWIDQGVGCSKVPDISNVALMEDRATCRISSQHVANWLHHGVVSADQVEESLRRMAAVVDGQNETDPAYVPMAPSFDGVAFRAARDLVFGGRSQPSGYTEPILHQRRSEQKAHVAKGTQH